MNLSPLPIAKFWDSNGEPLVGGLLFVYAASTATKSNTWKDADGLTLNTNPIVLDYRGEARVWLDINLTYKFVLSPRGDTDPPTKPIWTVDKIAAPMTLQDLTQSIIGALLYRRTDAEIAAGVTPTNYGYPPGHLYRYGTNTTPGTTDMTAALAAALSVQQDVFVPGEVVKTTSAVSMLSNQTLYGIGPDSQLSCNGTTTNAINIDGKTRAIVRNLFVKCVSTYATGGDSAAVCVKSASTYFEVRNCRLEGTRSGVTIVSGDYGVVDDNQITSAQDADACWDIAIYGNGSHNRITRNKCFGGIGDGSSTANTLGIQILISGTGAKGDYNIVTDNEIGTHTTYGMLAYVNIGGGASSSHTIFANNHVHDITGTYVSGTASFGAGLYITTAEWVTAIGNTFYRTNVSTANDNLAPGAIGVNGTSCFTLQGNIIRDPLWYGIYVVGDGNGLGSGLIEGNGITGCVAKAGIRINSTNNVSLLGNSINGVVGQDDGIVVDSGGSQLVGISAIANKVTGFSGTGCAGMKIQHCTAPKITGNRSSGNTLGYNFDVCLGGDFSGNEARGSSTYDGFFGASNVGPIFFDRNTFVSTATNGVQDTAGALVYGINDIAGQTNPFVTANPPLGRVLATSATPSVANQRLMYYGGATAVTDLLNPMPGQVLTIVSTATPTFQHNTGAATTKLLLNGAANFVMAANNTLTVEYLPGGPWIEVSRKV